MKKIFMGLTALSTLSFSAIELGTAQPTADTNVFTANQNGKIVVEGSVTSTAPIIKYVVYTSENGSFDPNNDKWNLNEITVGQTEESSTISEVPKKVYVKRVNGANNGVDELQGETVSFLINRDPHYTTWYLGAPTTNPIAVGAKVYTGPTGLLSKTDLETVITASGLSGTVSNFGDINIGSNIYRTAKYVEFFHSTNGVLEFNYIKNPYFTDNALTPEENSKIETAFSTKQTISNVSVSVTIN